MYNVQRHDAYYLKHLLEKAVVKMAVLLFYVTK